MTDCVRKGAFQSIKTASSCYDTERSLVYLLQDSVSSSITDTSKGFRSGLWRWWQHITGENKFTWRAPVIGWWSSRRWIPIGVQGCRRRGQGCVGGESSNTGLHIIPLIIKVIMKVEKLTWVQESPVWISHSQRFQIKNMNKTSTPHLTGYFLLWQNVYEASDRPKPWYNFSFCHFGMKF